MNMKVGETVKPAEVIYSPQVFKNILRVSRLASKGSMTRTTQYKTTTKKIAST